MPLQPFCSALRRRAGFPPFWAPSPSSSPSAAYLGAAGEAGLLPRLASGPATPGSLAEFYAAGGREALEPWLAARCSPAAAQLGSGWSALRAQAMLEEVLSSCTTRHASLDLDFNRMFPSCCYGLILRNAVFRDSLLRADNPLSLNVLQVDFLN